MRTGLFHPGHTLLSPFGCAHVTIMTIGAVAAILAP